MEDLKLFVKKNENADLSDGSFDRLKTIQNLVTQDSGEEDPPRTDKYLR